MAVKPLLHGVALLALVAAASACGSGHSNATRLTIEVRDYLGLHAWRLGCNPPSGAAPAPKAICSQLRRSPELLVGDPWAVWQAQYNPASRQPVFRVSGRYRGYPIDATFREGGGVPGQKGAYSTWWSLMNGAEGTGAAEQQFASAVVTQPERKLRSRQEARDLRLRSELHTLLARRTSALAAGDLGAVRARPARRAHHPRPAGAGEPAAWATSRERDGLLGDGSEARPGVRRAPPLYRRHAPLYELVLRFAYRDYTGRRHLGGIGYTSVGEEFFGKSIPPIQSFGPFPGDEQGPNFGQLGRPVTLTFPDR